MRKEGNIVQENPSNALEIKPLDLSDALQAKAFVALLDHYAAGESGGGAGLAEQVKRELPARLLQWPGFVAYMAWSEREAVGLINCFTGFSTFKAKPLLNVHDVIVHGEHRGKGVARALFAAVESAARASGCCKITLEVLEGNGVAKQAYASFGFRPYELDPAMGRAQFYEKLL
jgi:GNAT superfamily N-acetyltransferase